MQNLSACNERPNRASPLLGAVGVAAVAQLALLLGCAGYDPWEFFPGGSGGHAGAGQGPPGCNVDGLDYEPGESFPSSDGCNTCFCGEDGLVGCTERACADICGGLLGLPCGDDQYCEFPPDAQCGAADQTGVCRFRPDFCTEQFDPVCGCDGETYGNACFAAVEGASILSRGACDVECRVDDDCPVPPCACLDEDGDGACENECPVAICEDGRCSVGLEPGLGVGESCGGFRPVGSPDCAAGLFCQHQAGALCGAADAPGECVVIPDVCPAVVDPVCGCDGETYGNACAAAAAEIGIFELGACE